MFKKKFFLIFKLTRVPYPDKDNDNKKILIINTSI